MAANEDEAESEETQLQGDESKDASPAAVPPDGGYGWFVVVCSCLNLILQSSAFISFTVLLPEFKSKLNMETSHIALIGSIQTGFMFYFSVMSGAVITRLGCRPASMAGVFLTGLGFILASHATLYDISRSNKYIIICMFYGAISGIGISLAMTSTIIIVQQYFTTRRALASGLCLCGLSVGQLIIGPVLQALIAHYSLSGALLIFGGLILHGLPLSLFFRPLYSPPPPIITTVTQRASYTHAQKLDLILNHLFRYKLFKNMEFVLYCIGNFLMNYGSLSYMQHLIYACINKGIAPQNAALVLTVVGVSSLVSRVLFSFIADLKSINRVVALSVITVVSGLAVALTFLAKSFVDMIVIAGVVYGTCQGAITTIQIVVLVDLVGIEALPNANGIFSIFIGTSVLLGSPLTGKMRDKLGSYDKPFAFNGCVEILGGLIMLSIYVVGKLRKKSKHREVPEKRRQLNGHIHCIDGTHHGNNQSNSHNGNNHHGDGDHAHGNGKLLHDDLEMGPV